jgi:G:T-mismatch repair DNA endonuclease (very short patch repair protein)
LNLLEGHFRTEKLPIEKEGYPEYPEKTLEAVLKNNLQITFLSHHCFFVTHHFSKTMQPCSTLHFLSSRIEM